MTTEAEQLINSQENVEESDEGELEAEATEEEDETISVKDESELESLRGLAPASRRIKDLFSDYSNKELDPTPGFQRGFIWNRSRASRLIESVFLNLPTAHIILHFQILG